MGTVMGKEQKISQGQAGFRPDRSCVDHVYTVRKVIQGRNDTRLITYCFVQDVQKAYDAVRRNGLWKKLRGVRMIGKIAECTRSAVMLDGEVSNFSKYFTRSRTGMYAITQFIQDIY